MDMCMDMHIEMCMDMRIDMCMDMRIDMCISHGALLSGRVDSALNGPCIDMCSETRIEI